jgi:UDP-GlcNAc:undecaprenyl-phosphate GlcNAc-1-phosphate transferase
VSDRALLALAVFAATTLVSATLVPLTIRGAHVLGVLDTPGDRKIHTAPTPRMGGIAVFLAFTGVVGAGYLLLPGLSRVEWIAGNFATALVYLREAFRVETRLLALLLGGTLVFATGVADDVFGRRFPVWAKAGGMLAAAVILVASGVSTSFLPWPWLNVVVTLAWLFGISNAFNLLDNMDGLSAGVAFVACGVLLANAWALDEFFICLLLVAFMGSLLGFLFFNFNPASVFLGDGGSLFIGYVLASLTLLERYVSRASSTLFPILMPVLICAVPIVDTATVVFIRLREKRPIYVGDARHLSHRLVDLGFTQRQAVLLLYLLTLSLGLGAASLIHAGLRESLMVLVQLLGFVALVLLLLFHPRRA